MKFDAVDAVLVDIPSVSTQQGRTLYDHILKERPQAILELGFAHGGSSCYMAAALDEIGRGRVLTIDQELAKDRDPDIYEVMARCGLERFIEPVFAERSYNWEMMRLLEKSPWPMFDFIFIDGAHTWDVDGFAFFLADRFLRRGGWMCFDDLDWTLASSATLKAKPETLALPREEQVTPQVGKVFDLLVSRHPSYTELRKRDGFGWARKRTIREELTYRLRRRSG